MKELNTEDWLRNKVKRGMMNYMDILIEDNMFKRFY